MRQRHASAIAPTEFVQLDTEKPIPQSSFPSRGFFPGPLPAAHQQSGDIGRQQGLNTILQSLLMMNINKSFDINSHVWYSLAHLRNR